MRKTKLTIPILLLSLCLSACQSKGKEDVAEDFHEVQNIGTDSDAEETPVDDFKPLNYQDSQFEVTTDFGGYSRAKIYTADRVVYDDAYLKQMAETLFDKESWEVCKPFEICSKTELQDELDRINEINKQAEDGKIVPISYRAKVEHALKRDDNDSVQSLDDSCIAQYELAGNISEAALFKGKIDGKDYVMMYNKLNIPDDDYDTLYKLMHPSDIRIQRIAPTYNCSGSYNMDYTNVDLSFGENLVDEEEAKREAEYFLSELGIDDFVIVDQGKRACNISENERYFDGYSFTFVRQIDDVVGPLTDFLEIYDPVYTAEGESVYLGGAELIRVDVDSEGIALVDFYNMYEIGEALETEPQLLSYNDAVKLVNQFPTYLIQQEEPFKINAQFTYVPCTYEGKSVFMPAWIWLESKDVIYKAADDGLKQDMMTDYVVFGVNAVDGSLINYQGMNVYSFLYSNYRYYDYYYE